MGNNTNVRKLQMTPTGQFTLTIPTSLVASEGLAKSEPLKFETVRGEIVLDENVVFILRRVKK